MTKSNSTVHCSPPQNAPQNLNVLRKIALQRISQMKDKLSKKKRGYRASLNNDYLKQVLVI